MGILLRVLHSALRPIDNNQMIEVSVRDQEVGQSIGGGKLHREFL